MVSSECSRREQASQQIADNYVQYFLDVLFSTEAIMSLTLLTAVFSLLASGGVHSEKKRVDGKD